MDLLPLNNKFNRCLGIAKNHLPRHTEPYKHYSFLLRGKRLVAWEVNCSLEPPRHFGYHSRGYAPKMHSELALMLKWRPEPGFDVVNIRLSRTGEVRLAKPCNCCLALLIGFGCRRVYYSGIS